jgi:hypothetical protein
MKMGKNIAHVRSGDSGYENTMVPSLATYYHRKQTMHWGPVVQKRPVFGHPDLRTRQSNWLPFVNIPNIQSTLFWGAMKILINMSIKYGILFLYFISSYSQSLTTLQNRREYIYSCPQ